MRGTSGGVFRSTDRGASWTAVNSGSLSSSTVYAFAVVDSSIFAGFYYGGVYVSTNLGTTWTDVSTGIAGYNVRCLFRSNANLFAGTYGDGGAWRRPLGEMLAPAAPALVSPANNSTNQSLTPTLDWSAVPGASSYRIQVGTDSTFGSSVLDSSLIVSDSVVIPGSRLQGETKYYWRAHAINAAGTGGWSPVWNFTTGPGTLVGNAPEIPEHFELFSNYPNPFNPTTTIRFALPVSSEVMLRVYDVVGREVATLAEGIREAGYHTVVWNGQSISGTPMASGVYFFRLNAKAADGSRSFTDMKKIMFLK